MQLSPWMPALALATGSALQAPEAQAQGAPTEGLIGIKWMNYQDSQGKQDRIRVQARTAFVTLPLPNQLAIDASQTIDVISGASPSYYTEPAAFATMHDLRRAHDVRLSWFPGLQKWSIGQTRSNENDYLSQGASLSFAQASVDRNISAEVALSQQHDTINPVNHIVTDQHKNTRELLLGTTLVMGPRDLVQISWTHSQALGYLSDPYKFFDLRPHQRRAQALAMRWNHHHTQGTTTRMSTRLHQDSFGIRSLMLQGEYSQPIDSGWTLTPLLRYYSQTRASFFSPPDPTHPSQPQIPPGTLLGITPLSFDQRLAAFGALTAGVKLEKQLTPQTTVDLRLDQYRQRARWSLLSRGTTGLADLSATIVQLGVRQRF